MGAAIGLGGLAQGLAQGLKLGSDMKDAEEKRALMKDQNERDKTRFGFEQEEMSDKSRRRKLLAEAEQEYADADKRFSEGRILELQDTAPKQGIQAPAMEANPSAQPAAAIQTPATGSVPAAAPAAPAAPRAAISAPGAAPVAEAQPPAQPKQNPFITPGEEKYQDKAVAFDKYYEMKGNALSKMLMASGNYKDALQVPKMMRELRDNNWTEKVGASLAGMVANAPGAREGFAKVYDNITDGWKLDPSKGQYDPAKGWTGLERINADGKRESFNMSAEQAMVVANKYRDPGEAIKFMLESQRNARQEKREDVKVTNDTTRANASMISANADMAYKGKYGDYLERKGTEEADSAKQKAKVEAVQRMFPNANKEYKAEDLMLEKDKGKAKLEARAQEAAMFNKTLDLMALNPKVSPVTIGQIARTGRVQAQQDASGRAFTMVGDVKVYLQ